MINKVEKIQLNPTKSAITLSIPLIALIFLDTIYGIVDIYWINGLGMSAIICMGYISNAVYFLNKVGDGIGRSVNVLISNAFGANENDKTEIYASHGLILILALSIIIPLISIPFIKTICITAGLEKYSDLIFAYLSPLLTFIIITMMNNYFSSILGSEGDTKRATIIIIAGNLFNLILDPILIFNLKLGMFGAGIATTIGCGLSFVLFFYLFYIKKDTMVKINLHDFKYELSIFKEIITLTIPIILDGIIISAVGIFINYALHIYSTPVVAFAYVIILRIETTAFAPTQGLSKGLCIVTGHLAGAKRYKTLEKTLKKIFTLGLIVSVMIAIIVSLFQGQIIGIFSSQHIVIAEAKNQLIFMLILLIINPIITMCSYTFLGLEKSSYTFYFIIFNFLIVISLIALFTEIFAMSAIGIFLGAIIGHIIESIIMLFVLQRLISNRISSEV